MSESVSSETGDQKSPGRMAFFLIMATVFLDTMGFGLIIPVMPKLLTELTGEGLDQAALVGANLMVIYAVMQFIFAPVMGNLSDRFGRRRVIVACLLVFSLDYIVMGFAPTLIWLFIGRIIAGITGSTNSVANAYIADISSDENRAGNFGLLGMAWGLGFIMGPALGGLLAEFGTRAPFFAAAGITFATGIAALFFLPESLAVEKRRPFKVWRANPLGAILVMRQYPIIVWSGLALLFYFIAHDANPAIFSYYAMLKFDFTPADIGTVLAAVGICSIIISGFVVRKVVPIIGEPMAVYIGLFLAAIGFTWYAFATHGWELYAAIVPMCFMGLAMPALRSIMAAQVPEDAQGELQGAITSLMSLTFIVSPVIMSRLFHAYSAPDAPVYFPGAPYLLAGILMTMALVTVLILFRAFRVKAVAPAE